MWYWWVKGWVELCVVDVVSLVSLMCLLLSVSILCDHWSHWKSLVMIVVIVVVVWCWEMVSLVICWVMGFWDCGELLMSRNVCDVVLPLLFVTFCLCLFAGVNFVFDSSRFLCSTTFSISRKIANRT